MTRVEDNNNAIEVIIEHSKTTEASKVVILADISKSLAVIADALSERRAEKKDEISKAADEYFEKLINGEFGEGGPHATD